VSAPTNRRATIRATERALVHETAKTVNLQEPPARAVEVAGPLSPARPDRISITLGEVVLVRNAVRGTPLFQFATYREFPLCNLTSSGESLLYSLWKASEYQDGYFLCKDAALTAVKNCVHPATEDGFRNLLAAGVIFDCKIGVESPQYIKMREPGLEWDALTYHKVEFSLRQVTSNACEVLWTACLL
jgi:hypothetical protein